MEEFELWWRDYKWPNSRTYNEDAYWAVHSAYHAAAAPRDKRIAELETTVTKLESCLPFINLNQDVMMMNIFEREGWYKYRIAELEEILNMNGFTKCDSGLWKPPVGNPPPYIVAEACAEIAESIPCDGSELIAAAIRKQFAKEQP